MRRIVKVNSPLKKAVKIFTETVFHPGSSSTIILDPNSPCETLIIEDDQDNHPAKPSAPTR